MLFIPWIASAIVGWWVAAVPHLTPDFISRFFNTLPSPSDAFSSPINTEAVMTAAAAFTAKVTPDNLTEGTDHLQNEHCGAFLVSRFPTTAAMTASTFGDIHQRPFYPVPVATRTPLPGSFDQELVCLVSVKMTGISTANATTVSLVPVSTCSLTPSPNMTMTTGPDLDFRVIDYEKGMYENDLECLARAIQSLSITAAPEYKATNIDSTPVCQNGLMVDAATPVCPTGLMVDAEHLCVMFGTRTLATLATVTPASAMLPPIDVNSPCRFPFITTKNSAHPGAHRTGPVETAGSRRASSKWLNQKRSEVQEKKWSPEDSMLELATILPNHPYLESIHPYLLSIGYFLYVDLHIPLYLVKEVVELLIGLGVILYCSPFAYVGLQLFIKERTRRMIRREFLYRIATEHPVRLDAVEFAVSETDSQLRRQMDEMAEMADMASRSAKLQAARFAEVDDRIKDLQAEQSVAELKLNETASRSVKLLSDNKETLAKIELKLTEDETAYQQIVRRMDENETRLTPLESILTSQDDLWEKYSDVLLNVKAIQADADAQKQQKAETLGLIEARISELELAEQSREHSRQFQKQSCEPEASEIPVVQSDSSQLPNPSGGELAVIGVSQEESSPPVASNGDQAVLDRLDRVEQLVVGHEAKFRLTGGRIASLENTCIQGRITFQGYQQDLSKHQEQLMKIHETQDKLEHKDKFIVNRLTALRDSLGTDFADHQDQTRDDLAAHEDHIVSLQEDLKNLKDARAEQSKEIETMRDLQDDFGKKQEGHSDFVRDMANRFAAIESDCRPLPSMANALNNIDDKVTNIDARFFDHRSSSDARLASQASQLTMLEATVNIIQENFQAAAEANQAFAQSAQFDRLCLADSREEVKKQIEELKSQLAGFTDMQTQVHEVLKIVTAEPSTSPAAIHPAVCPAASSVVSPAVSPTTSPDVSPTVPRAVDELEPPSLQCAAINELESPSASFVAVDELEPSSTLCAAVDETGSPAMPCAVVDEPESPSASCAAINELKSSSVPFATVDEPQPPLMPCDDATSHPPVTEEAETQGPPHTDHDIDTEPLTGPSSLLLAVNEPAPTPQCAAVSSAPLSQVINTETREPPVTEPELEVSMSTEPDALPPTIAGPSTAVIQAGSVQLPPNTAAEVQKVVFEVPPGWDPLTADPRARSAIHKQVTWAIKAWAGSNDPLVKHRVSRQAFNSWHKKEAPLAFPEDNEWAWTNDIGRYQLLHYQVEPFELPFRHSMCDHDIYAPHDSKKDATSNWDRPVRRGRLVAPAGNCTPVAEGPSEAAAVSV